MKNIGFYNGTIAPLEKLTMPVLDRANYFGDGVYDALYCRGRTPFALDEHLDRFYDGLEKLEIPFRIPRADLAEIFFALLEQLEDPTDGFDGYTLYWQVSRGTAIRSHAFPSLEVSQPNLLIMITPRTLTPRTTRLKLITLPDVRFELCHIKTLNLLPSVLATQRALSAGCDEAVLHRDGVVTECAHSNVSILTGGVLRTRRLDKYILPGTTRAQLLRHGSDAGLTVDETPFTLEELFAADEVIVTSVSMLCIPACEIDGKPVGGKAPELLKRLQDASWDRMMRETA
ncbi:MAG: aminotransferase class IV [Oscillospiraceae bacterium]|jgi:D-alanine transaminase|nr:aminotransferase class IV [Oscillospiraceae bacterium]